MRMKPVMLAMTWSVATLFTALLGMAPGTVRAQVAVPPLTSPVVDTTRTLTPVQRARLERQALELQRRKGSQLQILIVPSTRPEDIADYAQRVFTTWELGREGVNDGVLLLVAKNDRRARIHVGSGLEHVITSDAAGRIIQTALVPRVSAGDFNGGIVRSSAALAALVDGARIDGGSPPARATPAVAGPPRPSLPAREAEAVRALPSPVVPRDPGASNGSNRSNGSNGSNGSNRSDAPDASRAAPATGTFDAQKASDASAAQGTARTWLHGVLMLVVIGMVLVPIVGGVALLVYGVFLHAWRTARAPRDDAEDDDTFDVEDPEQPVSDDDDDWTVTWDHDSSSSGSSSSGGWSGGGGRSSGGGASGGW